MLTEEEIEAADCIIVAADAQVPMDRFDGKKVISVRCPTESVIRQMNW